jgi:aspartate ammonia-lyase
VVNQVAFQVIGADVTITMASEGGQLQLNVFEPVIAYNLFNSINMMKNAFETLATKCIDGITANEDRCLDLVLNSIGLVTALNPFIGYENSTLVAKEALKSGRSVYDLVLEKELLSKEELDEIIKPENMIKPRLNK